MREVEISFFDFDIDLLFGVRFVLKVCQAAAEIVHTAFPVGA
jgi:hypothetical protein